MPMYELCTSFREFDARHGMFFYDGIIQMNKPSWHVNRLETVERNSRRSAGSQPMARRKASADGEAVPRARQSISPAREGRAH